MGTHSSVSDRVLGRALVTGASSGIGRALARELAPRAGSLVLTARRVDRLQDLATELAAESSGTQVTVVPTDLADPTDRSRLASKIRDLELDTLVCAAGVSTYAWFDDEELPALERMVDVNLRGVLDLVHAALPGMLRRRSGRILIVSSGSAVMPFPRIAGYCATKFGLHGFCESLHLELRGTGVTLTETAPGPVRTELAATAGVEHPLGPTWMTISAERCAQDSISGLLARRPLVFPGTAYGGIMRLTAGIPLAVARRLASAGSPRRRL